MTDNIVTVPDKFEADSTGNQHHSVVTKIAPVISHVKLALYRGQPLSKVTIDLFDTGVLGILYMSVLREATGAGIGDLKGFSRWWNNGNLTNPSAYDQYAEEIGLTPRCSEEECSLLPYA